MNHPVEAECRRCHRPLTSRLAVAAGVGARCALLDAAEAASGPYATGPGNPNTVARTAVALIAAHTGRVEQRVHDELAADADPVQVASILAAGVALALARTEGGARLLHGLGLAAAADGSP